MSSPRRRGVHLVAATNGCPKTGLRPASGAAGHHGARVRDRAGANPLAEVAALWNGRTPLAAPRRTLRTGGCGSRRLLLLHRGLPRASHAVAMACPSSDPGVSPMGTAPQGRHTGVPPDPHHGHTITAGWRDGGGGGHRKPLVLGAKMHPSARQRLESCCGRTSINCSKSPTCILHSE